MNTPCVCQCVYDVLIGCERFGLGRVGLDLWGCFDVFESGCDGVGVVFGGWPRGE